MFALAPPEKFSLEPVASESEPEPLPAKIDLCTCFPWLPRCERWLLRNNDKEVPRLGECVCVCVCVCCVCVLCVRASFFILENPDFNTLVAKRAPQEEKMLNFVPKTPFLVQDGRKLAPSDSSF